MQRLVLLDDAKVMEMLRRPDVLERFPFLRTAAAQLTTASTTVRSCCGRSSATTTPNFSGIRATIDRMPESDKEALKTLLKTQRIRLYYLDAYGHSQKATF